MNPGGATIVSKNTSRRRFLTICAWAVHVYTALGAVLGLLSIAYAAADNFRASFIALGFSMAIDASDGALARAADVRRRASSLDGTLLDNLVDYLTYVVAPVFIMIRARLLGAGLGGLALASAAVLASAYQFSQTNAKTPDHYFLGWPSYWNLVAFYLYCLRLSILINRLVVLALIVLVFVPIKYIYPSRTKPLRRLTVGLGLAWALVTAAMLPQLPRVSLLLLYPSLGYVGYYFVLSFILHTRALVQARTTPAQAKPAQTPDHPEAGAIK